MLFYSLQLLPVWTDELSTLTTVAHPVREIIPIVQQDTHPPLYYILLRGWTKVPQPWSGIASLRAFSAFWALLATLLLHLFWTRTRESSLERWICLVLFALSPCLLLYGRMARSYTMQVTLALLSLGLLRKWMLAPQVLRFGVTSAVAMVSLLYTHYLPGVAILAGFALIGWRCLGEVRAGIFLMATVLGYLPWLINLSEAIRRWQEATRFSATYTLTGNAAAEQILKIGFGVVSLTIGESFLAISLLLTPVLVLMAILGVRKSLHEGSREFTAMLGIAAVVGYLGVSRWVSYPFIPARLLWLLPFLSGAIALGIVHLRRPAWRQAAVVAVVLSYLGSTVLYFRRENFLNLGYAAPLEEIADTLNRTAQPHDVILVDSYNTDFLALGMYLSDRTRIIIIDGPNASTARGMPSVPRVPYGSCEIPGTFLREDSPASSRRKPVRGARLERFSLNPMRHGRKWR